MYQWEYPNIQQGEIIMSDTTKAAVPTTEADKIWAEIRHKPVDMFALPNQTVESYCEQAKIDPNRCFLLYKKSASAIIPALENSIAKDFTIEVMDKYIIVARRVSLIPTFGSK
jgi:hypothetical protein